MVRIFTKSTHRSFGTLMQRKGSMANQKRVQLSKRAAVVLALGGMASSCQRAKEGQIASIMA